MNLIDILVEELPKRGGWPGGVLLKYPLHHADACSSMVSRHMDLLYL